MAQSRDKQNSVLMKMFNLLGWTIKALAASLWSLTRLIMTPVLKVAGKLLSKGGKAIGSRLHRLGIRMYGAARRQMGIISEVVPKGVLLARHRIFGEKGTVVLALEGEARIMDKQVFDSSNLDIKAIKKQDLAKNFNQDFSNGVPDFTVQLHSVKNINPFRKDGADKAYGLLYKKPAESYSFREEYWKNKNGITANELTPEQKFQFELFAEQQDKLIDRVKLEQIITADRTDKVIGMLTDAAANRDFGRYRNYMQICNQQGDNLFKNIAVEQCNELMNLLRKNDASLNRPDVLWALAQIPLEEITVSQELYLRVMAAIQPADENTRLADDIIRKKDFNAEWARNGMEDFMKASDNERSAMIMCADRYGNKEALEWMANHVLSSVFNLSNIQSRGMYKDTVFALAFLENKPDSPVFDYFTEVQKKINLCMELDRLCYDNPAMVDSEEYKELQNKLIEQNKSIARLYGSEEIIGIEYAKVDTLLDICRKNSSGSNYELSPEVANALAGVVYNLYEVGKDGPVLQTLKNTGILDQDIMKVFLEQYINSEKEAMHFRNFESYIQPLIPQEKQQIALEETIGNYVPMAQFKFNEVSTLYEKDSSIKAAFEEMLNPVADNDAAIVSMLTHISAQALAYFHDDISYEQLIELPFYHKLAEMNEKENLYDAVEKVTRFFVTQSEEAAGHVAGETQQEQSVDDRTEQPAEEILTAGLQPEAEESVQLNDKTPVQAEQIDDESRVVLYTPNEEKMAARQQLLDQLTSKYVTHATLEQFCTLVRASQGAYNIWSENPGQWLELMDNSIAAAKAYKNGEIDYNTLLQIVPSMDDKQEKSKEYADKQADRVISIYEGREKCIDYTQSNAEEKATGYHRSRR